MPKDDLISQEELDAQLAALEAELEGLQEPAPTAQPNTQTISPPTNPSFTQPLAQTVDPLEMHSEGKPEVHLAEFTPLFTSKAPAAALTGIDLLLDVALQISVELGRSSMVIKDVLALGQGSVIELDKLAGEPVDILVNSTLIARGEVVVVDEKFGVRVTEVVSPAKRLASLG